MNVKWQYYSATTVTEGTSTKLNSWITGKYQYIITLVSCNPIGQFCLGGLGYSSRTVRGTNQIILI